MVYTAYTFKNIFQYREQDVYWCTADIGWITGHSYIIYGPLGFCFTLPIMRACRVLLCLNSRRLALGSIIRSIGGIYQHYNPRTLSSAIYPSLPSLRQGPSTMDGPWVAVGILASFGCHHPSLFVDNWVVLMCMMFSILFLNQFVFCPQNPCKFCFSSAKVLRESRGSFAEEFR